MLNILTIESFKVVLLFYFHLLTSLLAKEMLTTFQSRRPYNAAAVRFVCLGGHGILCTAVAGHGKSGEGDFCDDAGGNLVGILSIICWSVAHLGI